ncbi:MAG TPA: methyltransferase [Sphingomicrobium sp.]|jgi:predicted methyltransferase
MKHHLMTSLAAGALLSLGACQQPVGVQSAATMAQNRLPLLQQAVAHPGRAPANLARDRYRHPVETLNFFEVDPSDTVVEIWPGGGWYTEILGPYVATGGGKLFAASFGRGSPAIDKLKLASPAIYGGVDYADFPAFDANAVRVPDGTADVVLTFRNVHNWRMGARRDDNQDYSAEAFRQMFAMLKPGGVLGVVDHRLPESASDERERTSGYMKMSTVHRLAKEAGFQLADISEINANPKDTADWPDGVWTLPPALRLRDKDREKYLAIGESDRMTLKFVKPR